MALREFTDAAGIEWTIYDIVPQVTDRRIDDRRQVAEGNAAAEERRADDRRTGLRSSRPVRLSRSWLCFESKEERRRLQPFPADWIHLGDVELGALLEAATPAPVRRPAT